MASVQIQKILTEGKLRPRFIIPVDLFGLPANYPEIERIAEKYPFDKSFDELNIVEWCNTQIELINNAVD